MELADVQVGDYVTKGSSGKVFTVHQVSKDFSMIASAVSSLTLIDEIGNSFKVRRVEEFRKLSFTEITLWSISQELSYIRRDMQKQE